MEVSSSGDDLLTVLAKFRQTLLGIPLPPPAPVDYEQALKDAQRESIEVWAVVRSRLDRQGGVPRDHGARPGSEPVVADFVARVGFKTHNFVLQDHLLSFCV